MQVNSRMSNDFGCPNGERADGELEDLVALGDVLSLRVGRFGRVVGGDAVPGCGSGTGPPER